MSQIHFLGQSIPFGPTSNLSSSGVGAIQHALPSSSTIPTPSTMVMVDPMETLFQQGVSLRMTGDFENSFKCLHRAAELGHMRAIYAVGWAYYQGLGISRDLEKAMEYFQKIAPRGDNDAAYHLAQCYVQCESSPQPSSRSSSSPSSSPSPPSSSVSSSVPPPSKTIQSSSSPTSMAKTVGRQVPSSSSANNAAPRPNFALEAITWYMVAARRGHALSQYRLGMSYMDGYGVPADPVVALRFLLQAAEQQYAEAEYRVGQCYEHGIGTEINLSIAFQWYLKAVHHNNPLAQFRLGQWHAEGKVGFLEKHPVQACQLHIMAAEQGHLPAQLQVAWCYRHGFGTNPSMEKAVHWYRKAAEQGSPIAQNQLAFCLLHGLGIECDPVTGVEFYLKAAQQGYIESQYNLACCYRDGIGTTSDPPSAAFWFQQAAQAGDHQAMKDLGWCYRFGFGIEQNDKKAFEWYMNAAREHDAIACANVAYYYRHGIGVTKSLEQAIEWYQIAAEANDSVAQYELGCLLYYGLDQDREQEEQQDSDNGNPSIRDLVASLQDISDVMSDGEEDQDIDVTDSNHRNLEEQQPPTMSIEITDPNGSNCSSSNSNNHVDIVAADGVMDPTRDLQIQQGIAWLSRSASQGYAKANEKIQELLRESERKLQEQGLLEKPQQSDTGLDAVIGSDAMSVLDTIGIDLSHAPPPPPLDDLWSSQSISEAVEEMVQASKLHHRLEEIDMDMDAVHRNRMSEMGRGRGRGRSTNGGRGSGARGRRGSVASRRLNMQD